jgi:hypothetical protein
MTRGENILVVVVVAVGGVVVETTFPLFLWMT